MFSRCTCHGSSCCFFFQLSISLFIWTRYSGVCLFWIRILVSRWLYYYSLSVYSVSMCVRVVHLLSPVSLFFVQQCTCKHSFEFILALSKPKIILSYKWMDTFLGADDNKQIILEGYEQNWMDESNISKREYQGLRTRVRRISTIFVRSHILYFDCLSNVHVFSKHISSCELVWQDRMLICKEFGTWKRNANIAGMQNQLPYCFPFLTIQKMLGSKIFHSLLVKMWSAFKNTLYVIYFPLNMLHNWPTGTEFYYGK